MRRVVAEKNTKVIGRSRCPCTAFCFCHMQLIYSYYPHLIFCVFGTYIGVKLEYKKTVKCLQNKATFALNARPKNIVMFSVTRLTLS